jgi:transcriptional regulator with XRE-family HTH domain
MWRQKFSKKSPACPDDVIATTPAEEEELVQFEDEDIEGADVAEEIEGAETNIPAKWVQLMRADREKAGISQATLSRRARLTDTYVGMLERGDRGAAPKRATVTALAKVLGQDPNVYLRAAGLLGPNESIGGAQGRTPVIDELRRDSVLTMGERDAFELLYRRVTGIEEPKKGSRPRRPPARP